METATDMYARDIDFEHSRVKMLHPVPMLWCSLAERDDDPERRRQHGVRSGLYLFKKAKSLRDNMLNRTVVFWETAAV